MFKRSRRAVAIALFVVAESLLLVSPAQGGPILNWLFGESAPTNDQVVAYYPPTAAYYPATSNVPSQAYYGGTPGAAYASSCNQNTVAYRVATPSVCCEPTVVYQAPQNICNPIPVACEPQRTSCWDRITSCFGGGASRPAVPVYDPVPRASYRTAWKQIPVTRYRPITTTDPVTGYPVTVMKACTTYTWQPDRQRCGFFGRLFGQCDPAPVAVNPCCPDPCMTTQCVVTSDSCGWGIPSMVPTPAVAPYYAPGAVTIPGSGAPSGTFPQAPSVPPTLSPNAVPAPGAGPPATSVPRSASPEPAETRPSLVPGYGDVNSGGGAPQPSPSATWNSGASNASPTAEDGTIENDAARTQTILSKPVPLPAFGNPAARSNESRPAPVPDPDATPARIEEEPSTPQLLNPGDQVAVLRSNQAWAVTTITWPTASKLGRRPLSTTTTAQPRPRRLELDESGWRSIAR